MQVRFVDESGLGFGWIHQQPRWMERASHAVAADGRVWLVDAAEGDGVEARVRALGEPAGVVQLLDRHGRDCAVWAARLGVPHYALPDALPDSPFEVVPVVERRGWRELALWWPERRLLVCTEALGTARHFRAGDEPLGVHPLLRLAPPSALGRLDPEHLLVGHGAGLHGPDTAAALAEALATARRRTPRWLASLAHGFVTGRR